SMRRLMIARALRQNASTISRNACCNNSTRTTGLPDGTAGRATCANNWNFCSTPCFSHPNINSSNHEPVEKEISADITGGHESAVHPRRHACQTDGRKCTDEDGSGQPWQRQGADHPADARWQRRAKLPHSCVRL